MRFNKCIASKPGLFENISLNLTDSLNVIYSDTDTGAVVLHDVLLKTLTMLSSSKKDQDNNNEIQIETTITLTDETAYLVSLTEDKTITIKNATSEEVLYTGNAESYDLENYIDNTNDQKHLMFKHVFRFADTELLYTGSYLPAVESIATNKLITPAAIDKILLYDDFYFDYLPRRIKKNNKSILTYILDHERKLSEIDKQINIIGIKGSRSNKLIEEKKRLNKKIEDLEKTDQALVYQLDILKKILSHLKQIENLNSDLTLIKEKVYKEKEKVKDMVAKEQELDQLFPHFKDVHLGDDKNLDKIQYLFHEIRNTNEKIDNYNIKRKQKFNKFKKFITIINLSAISFLGYYFYTNNFSFTTESNVIKSLILFLLLFTPFSVIFYKISSRSKDLLKLKSDQKKTIERLRVLLSNSNLKISQYKLSDLYGFLLQYFEDYIEYTERTREIKYLKNTLKDDTYLQNIQKKLEYLKQKEEMIRSEITRCINLTDNIRETNLNSYSINHCISSIQEEREILETEIKEKNRLIEKINNEINPGNTLDNHNDILIKEKNNIEQKLEELKQYTLSKNYINTIASEASQKKQEELLKKLIERIRVNYDALKGENASGKLDTRELNAFLTKNIVPRNLEQQELYSLVLSVKLALSDHLVSPKKNVPLLINEPFRSNNNEREYFLRELINTIAKKRQVIIFTKQKPGDDWGNIIEL